MASEKQELEVLVEGGRMILGSQGPASMKIARAALRDALPPCEAAIAQKRHEDQGHSASESFTRCPDPGCQTQAFHVADQLREDKGAEVVVRLQGIADSLQCEDTEPVIGDAAFLRHLSDNLDVDLSGRLRREIARLRDLEAESEKRGEPFTAITTADRLEALLGDESVGLVEDGQEGLRERAGVEAVEEVRTRARRCRGIDPERKGLNRDGHCTAKASAYEHAADIFQSALFTPQSVTPEAVTEDYERALAWAKWEALPEDMRRDLQEYGGDE